MYELIFEEEVHTDGNGYAGGPCMLENEIAWPLDEEKKPLFHLVSIPLQWLDEILSDATHSPRWISIFIPYDKENFIHYIKMQADALANVDAAVILHDMSGDARSMHPAQESASRNIKRRNLEPESDMSNIASHIFGTPTWVQDPIEIKDHSWIMSIYGPDLDASLIENPGILSDGVGYLFLKNELDIDNSCRPGVFYFQF